VSEFVDALRDLAKLSGPIIERVRAVEGRHWVEGGIDMTCTCAACPLQYEGTVDGVPAYFRARWNSWSFTIGPNPVRAWRDPEHHAQWDGEVEGEFGASWMEPQQAEAIMRQCVAEWRNERRGSEARHP
jgi:hypothetical protein